MKKFLLVLSAILVFTSSMAAKKEDDWRHNIQIEGVSTNKTNAVVKVTVLHKKKEKVTDDLLGKSAVYAILFKGYTTPSITNAGYGDSSQAPLVGGFAEEQQHADFFNPFFENGDYTKYVHVIESTRRVAKVEKKYKVSSTVSVNIEQLRKDLEQLGILRKLNSGW